MQNFVNETKKRQNVATIVCSVSTISQRKSTLFCEPIAVCWQIEKNDQRNKVKMSVAKFCAEYLFEMLEDQAEKSHNPNDQVVVENIKHFLTDSNVTDIDLLRDTASDLQIPFHDCNICSKPSFYVGYDDEIDKCQICSQRVCITCIGNHCEHCDNWYNRVCLHCCQEHSVERRVCSIHNSFCCPKCFAFKQCVDCDQSVSVNQCPDCFQEKNQQHFDDYDNYRCRQCLTSSS